MKKITFLLILSGLIISCNQPTKEEKNETNKTESASVNVKKVSVFTTADSTNMRLASNGELQFKQKGQPFENEISVFIDPTKTYQEFLGIGAALTDASAETYAKLP